MTNFDQSKHPRTAAGTAKGGQFAAKQNSAPESSLSAAPSGEDRQLSEYDRKIAQRAWEECKSFFKHHVSSEAFDWDGGEEDAVNPYDPVQQESVLEMSGSGVEYWSAAGQPGVLHNEDGPAIVAPGRLPHYRRRNFPTDKAGRPLAWGPRAVGAENWQELQDDQDLYDAYTIGARLVSEGNGDLVKDMHRILATDLNRSEQFWEAYQLGVDAQRNMIIADWRNTH